MHWDTDLGLWQLAGCWRALLYRPLSPPGWTRAKQGAFAPASWRARRLQPCTLCIYQHDQTSWGNAHSKAEVRTCPSCSHDVFWFLAGVGISLGRAWLLCSPPLWQGNRGVIAHWWGGEGLFGKPLCPCVSPHRLLSWKKHNGLCPA